MPPICLRRNASNCRTTRPEISAAAAIARALMSAIRLAADRWTHARFIGTLHDQASRRPRRLCRDSGGCSMTATGAGVRRARRWRRAASPMRAPARAASARARRIVMSATRGRGGEPPGGGDPSSRASAAEPPRRDPDPLTAGTAERVRLTHAVRRIGPGTISSADRAFSRPRRRARSTAVRLVRIA